jgi:hypothetical protein
MHKERQSKIESTIGRGYYLRRSQQKKFPTNNVEMACKAANIGVISFGTLADEKRTEIIEEN